MRFAPTVLATVASLLSFVGGSAQEFGQHGYAVAVAMAGADDSARCASLPPVGWRTDTVFGSVVIEPADSMLAGWDVMLLDGIRQYFRFPEGGRVPVYGGVYHPYSSRYGSDTVSLVIVGEAGAKLDRTGHLGPPKLRRSTLSQAIDQSLLAALRDLDSVGVIPPFPEMVTAHSVSVRFNVAQGLDSGSVAKPLAIVRQPMWLMERPVTAVRGNPKPLYPSDARQGRVEGEVLISFVVDQDGLARPETERIIRASNSQFEFAVREVIPRLRFHPASIDGCPVAQLVYMPFGFRIPR